MHLQIVLTILLSISSFVASSFAEAYMHDPLDNPVVLRDTVINRKNVFGFAPAKRDEKHPHSTLANFADSDFASFASVGKYRQTRIDYHEYVVARLDELMEKPLSPEARARAAIKIRSEARIASYLDAEGKVKPGMELGYKAALRRAERNTYEYFRKKRKMSNQEIFQSAYGANAGMDAVLGLYDRNFAAYKILVPSKVVASLNSEELKAYNRLYAHFSRLSLRQRDKLSFLYFMEPKLAAKMIVHLANWYC